MKNPIIARKPGHHITRRELQIKIDSAADNTTRHVIETVRREIYQAPDDSTRNGAVAELATIALSYEGAIEEMAQYIANLESRLAVPNP